MINKSNTRINYIILFECGILVLKLNLEIPMRGFSTKFNFHKKHRKAYLLALAQFLLGTFKVIIYIQTLEKFSYRVLVAVLLLLNNLDQIFKQISSPFVDHNCSSKVAKEMMRICLDSIQVPDMQENLGQIEHIIPKV